MSKHDANEALNANDQSVSNEELAAFLALGQRLSVQMAVETFQVVTEVPGWTVAHIKAAMETALERINIAACDALMGKGGDPYGAQWQSVWTEMEASYRETIDKLLDISKMHAEGALQ